MKNNKPVIFLDFDGLKFDTLPIHLAYYNQKYGIQSTASDYLNESKLEEVIKKYLPEDQHYLVVRELVYLDAAENLLGSIDKYTSVQPIDGMTEVLPLLAERYDLWTVTARQKSSIPVIEHLLNTHAPNCISGIHCVSEHLGNLKFADVSKKEFIAGFEGNKIAFIDDSAHEVEDMQDTILSYLFDPSGRNDGLQTIENRVRSWKEIGKIFLEDKSVH